MASSVLFIGASGRTGLELLRAANALPNSPAIHAFVRTPSKIPAEDSKFCTSIVKGDALIEDDIKNALESTAADTIIIAIGREDTGPTEVREKSAIALMNVIKPGTKFEHVKIVCISSDGAGDTKIKIGFGAGKILAFVLRHVLRDHDKQEAALKTGLGDNPEQKKRLLIVRPTGLTLGKAKGAVQLVGSANGPSHIDRADMAQWIMEEVSGEGSHFGGAVSMTHIV